MFFCYIRALIGVLVDALAGSSDELFCELVGALFDALLLRLLLLLLLCAFVFVRWLIRLFFFYFIDY